MNFEAIETIEMTGIRKSFAGVNVLKDTKLFLTAGETHALMGENGAGKSTLMKILTGVYTKDEGEIKINGKAVNFSHPTEAHDAGIVFIHQELNVIPDLSIEENIFMGKEIKSRFFGITKKREMAQKAKDIMARLGIYIDPRTTMNKLSIGQQQMVEIAKALTADAKVIIMDEPTAALSISETELLFEIIASLKAQGVSFVYISHRMEEIFRICDKITVLRDGEYIGTKNANETDIEQIIKMMIGREIGERFPARNIPLGEKMLEIDGFSKKGVFENISFDVHAGEVLGVAGLMGAGRTEIMKAIFGNLSYDSGVIKLCGKQIKIRKPRDAKNQGLAFITEDRKLEGLMIEEGIGTNISLSNLKFVSNAGILSRPKEKGLALEAIKKLNVKCTGPKQKAKNLSGGNQQKVVFAKWVYTSPKVLILDEPTRGVDIGAKKEIYNIINDLASDGVAIILVSSELPEVMGMSDRIMAICEGKVGGILSANTATTENIMFLCTGGKYEGTDCKE